MPRSTSRLPHPTLTAQWRTCVRFPKHRIRATACPRELPRRQYRDHHNQHRPLPGAGRSSAAVSPRRAVFPDVGVKPIVTQSRHPCSVRARQARTPPHVPSRRVSTHEGRDASRAPGSVPALSARFTRRAGDRCHSRSCTQNTEPGRPVQRDTAHPRRWPPCRGHPRSSHPKGSTRDCRCRSGR